LFLFLSISVHICRVYTVTVQGLLVPAVKTMTVVPMTCAVASVHLSACINY